MKKSIAILLAACAIPAGTAAADLVEEVRVGVFQHNICVLDCDNADKEDGPNIEGEIVFASPNILSFAFSPRPYIVASANTAGNTSYGGVGLHWTVPVGDAWSIEPGLGYVIHDGALESPFPQGDPRGDAFTEENVLLGSEDLFRTSLSLTRQINDRWAGQVTYEHLSHGQIIGSGRNQGMDSLGVRVAYKFGE